MTSPVLFWFRQDLRLSNNPGLFAAAKAGPVIGVYILDDSLPWPMGGASRWWLHHSLRDLHAGLKKCGVNPILQKGVAGKIIPDLAQRFKAKAVFWNRCYEPTSIARDTELKTQLKNNGIGAESYNASLLFEPWDIKNGAGAPYKVFTPFAKACLQNGMPPPPLPIPRFTKTDDFFDEKAEETLSTWQLCPTKPNWARGFGEHWQIGEKAAQTRLQDFFENGLASYTDGRDRPDHDYTSRLSPHLHFGEISPRQVFYAARQMQASEPALSRHADKFISEILWREFSYHLLYAFPHIPETPFNPAYNHFAWQPDISNFSLWCKGQTGIPIIDAGMRQLWQTGWMHNRVRMLAASFLTKNLLHPWQDGAKWFWDCLVDADLASNSASWQWVAGCGADAAPYYRIFNPVLQGEKFDPKGDYVRQYVPELKNLSAEFIHAPWQASPDSLKAAGIVLGKTYPQPIVDLKASRTRALEMFKQNKS